MPKLVKIYRCAECLHRNDDDFVDNTSSVICCHHPEVVALNNGGKPVTFKEWEDLFPDWCPLEDAPELPWSKY